MLKLPENGKGRRVLPFVLSAVVAGLSFWYFVLHIADAPLWLDESATAWFATHPLNELFEIMAHDNNPPLYTTIIHFWSKLFGFENHSLRLPSAFFMSLSSAIIFFSFARQSKGVLLGLAMAALFTLSNETIIYAHEARSYALLVLLGLINAISLKLLIETWNWKWRLFLIFSGAALLYTHYLGVYLLFLTGLLGLVFLKRENKLNFAFSYILGVGVLILPWLVPALKNVAKRADVSTWVEEPTWWHIKWVFRCFYNGEPLSWLIPGGIVVAVVLSILLRRTQKKNLFAYMTIGLWIAYFLHSHLLASIYIPRYLILLLPISVLAFGEAIRNIFGTAKWTILIFIFVVFSIQKHANSKASTYEEWDLIADSVKEFEAKSDVLFGLAPWLYIPYAYHYDKDCFEKAEMTGNCLNEKKKYFYYDPSHFEEVLQSEKPESIFYFGYQDGSFKEALNKKFASGYSLSDSLRTTHFNLQLWQKRPVPTE